MKIADENSHTDIISDAAKFLTSIDARSTFIKRADLVVKHVGKDLVISGNKVDGFLLSQKVPDSVIEYYLGTTHYNPNKYNVRSEYTGVKMSIHDGVISKIEGLVKYIYPDFFCYVKPEMVTEKKIQEHILDHYYVEYVVHISKNI
jgi:hypothetical protein